VGESEGTLRDSDFRSGLEIVKDLPILELNDDVRQLTRIYDQRLGLPPKAKADLLHISFAVSFEVDFLVTWNCAHIANGEVVRKLLHTNRELERNTPLILTPEELLETPAAGD
jgi:hypothetical protein